jgi:2-iminobutanoate/2-iminopropanoate deaminase
LTRVGARRIFAGMEIKTVETKDAPTPAGHYSQAVVYGGLVYVAGQLAIDPRTGERKLGSIEEQTEQTLANVAAILKAAGSDLSRVLKMTVYVADISLWGAVNETYARVLGAHRPARAVVPTKELHHGFLVEIEAVAALSE